MLERLGRGAARHHRIVLVLWLVAAVGITVASGRWGGESVDSFSIPGTNSQEAIDLLEERFPAASGASATVVFSSSSDLTTGDAATAIGQSVTALGTVPDVASTPPNPLTPALESSLVSEDKTIAYTSVSFTQQEGDLPTDTFDRMEQATKAARDAGLTVSYSGGVVDAQSPPGGSGGISQYADLIGLAAAAIILLISLGTAVAMAAPIGTALFGIVTSSSLLALAEGHLDIGSAAKPVGVMIGLGVGIDYSLFIVSRFRQELRGGRSVEDATGVALSQAGSAVLFAGVTVCVALAGLWLVGIPYVTTLGLTAAGFVLVAVTSALTFLPALLGAVGDRIDHWSIHRHGHAEHEGRLSQRWAAFVGRRAGFLVAGGFVILILLAVPAFRMDLGFPDAGDDPAGSTQREAYDLLAQGFGPGSNGPLLVVVTLPSQLEGSTTEDKELTVVELGEPLSKAIAADDDVVSATPMIPSSELTAGIIEITPKSGPADPATGELVERLRSSVVPQAIKSNDLSGQQWAVGGETAVLIDMTDLISSRLLYVILGIVGVAVVLLLVVFRSVAVSAIAAVVNVASIGAAYGVIVMVFQWGWGQSLVGLSQTIPVAPFIPVMMFAILFGLSMDYQVFLLSRVREEVLATGGDAREGVAVGLARTARVITSAALIMMSVFLAFVTNPEPIIKMIGFGMAVAVLVDASIVQGLVPALLHLLDKRGWWMPHWLDRILPHLEIEKPPAGAGAEPAPSPA